MRRILLCAMIGPSLAASNKKKPSSGLGPPNAEINIQVSNPDDESYTGKFQPSIKWETDGSWNGIDYEGGFSMRAEDLNTANFPCNLWGSARKTFRNWKLQANILSKNDQLEAMDLDVIAKGGPHDASLMFHGSVGHRYAEIHQLAVSKSYEAPGGTIHLTPRYNTNTGPGVLLDYDIDDTTVSLDADRYKQRVKVSQTFADNTVAPSISTEGEVQLQYRRHIGKDGILDIDYLPNTGTTVRYQHGPWDIVAEMPMDGFVSYKQTGIKVGLRRSVTLPTYAPKMSEEMEEELKQQEQEPSNTAS